MKTSSQGKLALVAAVLVGLFAIIAVNKYVADKTKVEAPPTATILAASKEIKEGGEIGPELLQPKAIPLEALSNIHIVLPAQGDPGFTRAYDEVKAKIVGRRVKRMVAAATPIFWTDIDTEPKVPFADLIGEGNRAVTMPVDSISSVCGFIRPGSRVDVVLTAPAEKMGVVVGPAAKTEGGEVMSYVILQNVPVIATDRTFDLQAEGGRSYGTITLNLPLKASLMMIQARSIGQITYLLRNVRDAKTETERGRISVSPGASFGDAIRQFEK